MKALWSRAMSMLIYAKLFLTKKSLLAGDTVTLRNFEKSN